MDSEVTAGQTVVKLKAVSRKYFTPVPELIHSYRTPPDSRIGSGVGGDELDHSVMKFS